ncbi:putative Ig domain-containing protein [Rhizobium sp. TH2]|uniref:putative Ig domain-containing protein n=1 Tax=Rhizobium sp. TH2 TaxID=2775403 RepID=UPI0021588496|nr:putative Ig domain-containing protein [Rhizobium sp. TH2]UVC10698.1 putative Ig domain-containing protein [Rhizobium sp. TH2]
MSVISGTETQINTYTTSEQSAPQITTLTDGGWVVTWMSYGQDGDLHGVYQQRYDADGTPHDSETPVNTITSGVQVDPQIAALGDGGWVVVWQSSHADGSYDLFSQAYKADGTPLGGEAAVNAPTPANALSQQVVALADGGWVVTWLSQTPDVDEFSFHQQSYNADGTIRSADAQVNSHPLSYSDGSSDVHRTTALADGGWVVSWSHYDPATSTASLVQQAYNEDGSAHATETLVTTHFDRDLQITSLTDGGWITTWRGTGDADGLGIYQQRYDSDGIAASDAMLVNTDVPPVQSDPSINALPGGGWVVAWLTLGQDGAIYQQAYSADGTPLGTEMMVNVTNASNEYDPIVTALVDGSWVVTWAYGEDGAGAGVFQQAFNPDGSRHGTELRVNDYTTGNQYDAQVTALPDGGWVVTWHSGSQDGDGFGVYQRVFHIDDHPPATMEGIANQTAPEDAPFTFQIPADLFSDFEGDAFTYSALVNGTDLPDWLHFDDATRTFTGTPANGDVGPLTVTVIVSSNNGAQTSNTFVINVTNTNDAPQLGGAIASGSAIEDSPFTFTFAANHFFDVDVGDTLTYSATSADGSALPDWLDFDPATRTFSGTPLNGDVGTLTVKVIASDGSLSASTTFDIVVENTNDAPVAIPFTPPTVMEDIPFSFSIAGAFTDADLGDTLSYEVLDYPAWMTFDASTGTISGALGNEYVGIVSITVRASDGDVTVDNTFELVVENTNDAPTSSGSLGEQDVFEDSELNFTFDADMFVDQDIGDTLTYSATLEDGSDLPDWLDFDPATRTFSGTPNNGDVGTLSIKLTASDGALSASRTFDLWVRNTNDAPVVSQTIDNQVVYEDSPFTLALQPGTFVDVDLGDTLTYSATMEDGNSLPEWLIFDAVTGTFTGTPLDADVGSFAIFVTAWDGSLGVTTSFTLTVNNVNDAPTGLDKTVTTLEDTAYTFSAADFGYADTENNGFKEIIVSALPGSGELKLGGVVVEAGDHIAVADLATLTWLADKDAYGDGLDAFSFQVVDDGQTAHGGSDTDATPDVISFDVDEVTDIYTGGNGEDNFTGTTAHDVFNGKGGRDKLTGDLGSDTFFFGRKYGRDTITDFEASGVDHDIVDLSKLKGFDNLKDVKAALEKHGSDVWLEAGKDVLVLEDVNIKHLGKGDFMF